MVLGRVRAVLLVGAVLVTTLPLVAEAVAPHLTCGPKQVGRWESIPVRPFQPISGLTATDVVKTYTVDEGTPQDVAVTNGARIQVSDSNGCDWKNGYALAPGLSTAQPFVGSSSSIVSLGLLRGRVLAAVQEGSGSASRPHVVVQGSHGWTVSDSGLPLQGAPRLLRTAADGKTAYLTISPTASGGSDVGEGTPLPDLPPLPLLPPLPKPGATTPTGLLYATADGGATWSLRTGSDALPKGGTGFSALDLDSIIPGVLYGIVDGKLMVSRDAGGTFLTGPGSGYTSVTSMFPGAVAALRADGTGVVSFNIGNSFVDFKGPAGATSIAWRGNDSALMVESRGVLRRVEPSNGAITAVPARTAARPGTLLGDNGTQSSFHAIAGHSLLRYVDPVPPQVKVRQIAAGDRSVTPPRAGVVTPSMREISLPVGKTADEDFTLDLPKNPTPLDLFFLMDVSTSMSGYLDNLKHNVQKIVDSLAEAKVDLKVGVGTLGTAPAQGEAPYPDTYVYSPTIDPQTGRAVPGPTYRKPRIYQRIREIGATGKSLRDAINSIHLETDPPSPHNGTYHEGQLLALEQMVTGSGIKTQQDDAGHLNTYSGVAPGQDAGFRANPDVRRVVVIASDEAFDVPYGTPQRPGSTVDRPLLDYTRTLKLLNDHRVSVFGITAGSPDSVPDMSAMARGTHSFSPPGGVSCGGDPEQVLPPGAPLVCSQDGDFSAIIGKVLAQLTDVQDVTLQPSLQTPVLRSLTGPALRGLDVKRANRAKFRVGVSCLGVAPGTYAFEVNALLRQTTVGTAALRVTCVAAQAAVFPVPLPPVPLAPPAAPAVQPPAPPPAPPPAAQPQPQPNPNINPLTAGVTQEQQQLQVALALNQMMSENEQTEQLEQLAMVDRRHRAEVQAFGSLLVAMTACAGLGLARLRTRPAVQIRQAR